MGIPVWLSILVLAVFLMGYALGSIATYSRANQEVIAQCNSYVQDHCKIHYGQLPNITMEVLNG